MVSNSLPVRCDNCGSTFDTDQLVGMVIRNPGPRGFAGPGQNWVSFRCSKCQNEFSFSVNNEQYAPFHDAICALERPWDEEAFEGPLEEGPWDEEAFEGEEENGLNHPAPKPIPTADTSKNKLDEFKFLIKKIDKNLPGIELMPQILKALITMIGEPMSDLQGCYKMVKSEFRLTDRDIEAFRKDLNDYKAQIELDKKRKEYSDKIKQYNTPPKELTEQEKQEALAYLKDPDLINNISRDIGIAGEVVGEETNKMMLYLSAISRKFREPISVVIFGKSSSGKSLLANAISKFVPEEDKIILSSASSQAFNYMGDGLKHKFVLVQEWEGIEKILPTIRVLQSEGKLSRLVTIQNPDNKIPEAVNKPSDCPCSIVITTTKEGIHDENSTRIFELYADETVAQTRNVVNERRRKGHIKHCVDEKEKERILNLHHNIQRVLEPFTVDIPYAKHISFPERATRNRRDVERFFQLIRVVAFLRQKQKKIKLYKNKKYIEADLDDYKVAYHLGIPVIASTLDQISERAKTVLRVCCALKDDLKARGNQQPWFTPKAIQEKASSIEVDLDNYTDLSKQLKALTKYEYLELSQASKGARKFYTVLFNYVRDEAGNIINLGNRDVKDITTPVVLREKLSST